MKLSLKMVKLNVLSLLIFPSLAMATPSIICRTSIPATTAHLVDNSNGTISDSKTGLMWKKCTEGQVYNAGNCTATSATYNWSTGLKRAQDVNAATAGEKLGFSGWRVPNINELTSIIEYRCYNSAINDTFFPNLPATGAGYWSSTPAYGYAPFTDQAWYAEFSIGGTNRLTKNQNKYVRLVRSE